MEARSLQHWPGSETLRRQANWCRMHEGPQSGHLELRGWNPGPQEVRAGVPGQRASPLFSVRVDWFLDLAASVPGTELSLGVW